MATIATIKTAAAATMTTSTTWKILRQNLFKQESIDVWKKIFHHLELISAGRIMFWYVKHSLEDMCRFNGNT